MFETESTVGRSGNFPRTGHKPRVVRPESRGPLRDLANIKRLPAEFLQSLGLEDVSSGIQIPYYLVGGELAPRQRIRVSRAGEKNKSIWNSGEEAIVPYGLNRLREAFDAGFLVLVEGESDCWTLWHKGFPALGIPGATMTNCLLPHYLTEVEKIYIVQEPDRGGTAFVNGITAKLRDPRFNWKGEAFVVSIDPAKDASDLYIRSPNEFSINFQKALDSAQPIIGQKPKLIVHDLIQFRQEQFPPREPFMVLQSHGTTIYSAHSMNQVFAWRGTGKTMFSLGLGDALATGGKFLCWQATRKVKVLLAEGETPNAQLQERANLLVGVTAPGYFRIITLDSQPDGIAPLSGAAGRLAFEDALNDAEVLILDSISTLAWIPTNDEEEWLDLLAWFARLRSRGLCIIFLHHAGKSGMQRGHSRSEDMLDTSLKLTSDGEERDFLKFNIEYDKFRGERRGVRTIAVELKGANWSWSLVETEKLQTLSDFLQDHPKASSRSVAKILPELGSHVTVSKLMAKLKKRGVL